MRKFRIAAALVLIAGMLLSLTGCSLKGKTEQYSDDEVIAKVDDVEITLGEYKEIFDISLQNYKMYVGYDPTQTAEGLEYFQDYIMDILLRMKVVPYQAKKQLGEKLTDAQRAELDEMVDAELKSWDNYYRETAQAEYEQDNTVDVEARVKELYEEEAARAGTDYEGLIELVKEGITNQYYEGLLKEHVLSELKVSDEDAQKWYDEALAEDTESFKAEPGLYFDEMSSYESYGGSPVTYAPGGYGRIMHIFTAPETDIGEDYTTKKIEMDELLLEYGRLAMESEYTKDSASPVDNSARLAEIMSRYYVLKGESEALWNEHYAESKSKIEEAYSKLESGADFAEVMKKYTQDEDFKQIEVYSQKGKLISSEHDNSFWSEAVISAYKALTPGSYSPIFMDEDGYHIIYFVAEEPEGSVPFKDLKDQIAELLLADKQIDEWEALMSEWTKDKSVTVYSEKIRGVGA
ncbi:MAG: peptidylprolyl isomerase [Firmicutes bacterium ADurb.Bin182]|nr:MAG: peptidylprolyl isomerase [Firmicutes bacterium ADurb.Bin182]